MYSQFVMHGQKNIKSGRPILWEMKKYVIESRRRGISNRRQRERRVRGLVRSGLRTAFKHVIEGKIEAKGRRGRRRKQLLDDVKETRGYWALIEALDRTLCATRFWRSYGPVVRQTTEWMDGWTVAKWIKVRSLKVPITQFLQLPLIHYLPQRHIAGFLHYN